MSDRAILAFAIFFGTAAIVAALRFGERPDGAAVLIAFVGLASGLLWVWK